MNGLVGKCKGEIRASNIHLLVATFTIKKKRMSQKMEIEAFRKDRFPCRIASIQALKTGNFGSGHAADQTGQLEWQERVEHRPADSAAGARRREALGSPSIVTSRAPIHAGEKTSQLIVQIDQTPKMLAVRQRAACVARRARPAAIAPRQATRSYASDHGHGDHHDHHAAPQVEESPGVRCP